MKKIVLLSVILLFFHALSAQKGNAEYGLNFGFTHSSPVNFVSKSYSVWAMKPLISKQFGITAAFQLTNSYALRFGLNWEKRGFRDSTVICDIRSCFKSEDELSRQYVSVPIVNEFQFLKQHLFVLAGVDISFRAKDTHNDVIDVSNDFGLIAGVGTQWYLTPRLRWRLESRATRSTNGWSSKYSEFTDSGLMIYSISTGFSYVFKRKGT